MATLGLFITSVLLKIDIAGGISFVIPAMFAGLMTFYRVKQNEYGLVERSAIVASLQAIIMEVDLATELNSTRLEVLLAEYRRIITGFTHFPSEIEKRLALKWVEEGIAIPEFMQTRISSSHMANNQLVSVDENILEMIQIESGTCAPRTPGM